MKGSEMVKELKKSDAKKYGKAGIMKYGTAQYPTGNSHFQDIMGRNWEPE